MTDRQHRQGMAVSSSGNPSQTTVADGKSKKHAVDILLLFVERSAEPLNMDLHTGDMPHACSHHAIHVQATAWPRVKGGSQMAFAFLFSLHLLGSLGTPCTLTRLTRSPGVTVTPTAAGGGGGVCAVKEAVVSNYTTWDLETEAQAACLLSPQSELPEGGSRWLGFQQTLRLRLEAQQSKFGLGVH